MLRLSLAVALAATSLCVAQNQALSFTNGGTDEQVDVAYFPGLLSRQAITVEAWVTYDDSTITAGLFRFPTIARQDVSPGGESWFLRVGAGNTGARSLEWACHNGVSLQFTSYQFPAGRLSNWTHVAATYDRSQARLYLDGVMVAQRTVSGLLRDNNGILRIGNGDVSSPGAEVWNGEIDELRIWPFAKTQAEIQASINDALFGSPNTVTFNFDGGLGDGSSGFNGVGTSGVTFVPGWSSTLPAPMGAITLGTPSTTCSQSLQTLVTTRAVLGESAFSFVVRDATPGVNGALFLAAGPGPMPVSILGIDLFLDPGSILPVALSGTVDSSGTGRANVLIANRPALRGASLFAQWVLIDPTCGALGLTASQTIAALVQ